MRLHIRFLLLLFTGFVTPVVGQTTLETTIQTGHSEAVLCLAIDTTGNYIATGSKDKSIILWDRLSGLQIRTLVGHDKSIRSIDFSTDGKYLLSSSNDQTAIVWDVLSGKQLFRSKPDKKVLTDARFINEHTIITAGYEDEAKVWDWNRNELIAKIPVNADQGTGYGVSIKVSSDKKWIALGEDNRSVRLINTQTWEMEKMLKPEDGWCGGCGTLTDFSADNQHLLVVPKNARPYMYSLSSEARTELDFDLNEPTGAAYLADGTTVLIADKHNIYQINTTSPHTIDTLTAEAELNHVIAIRNKQVLAALDNNKALEYSFVNEQANKAYMGILHTMEGTGIDYDPNSYWTSHIARYIKLKNPLQFTADGKNYLKGKSGLKVKVWDISGGNPADELSGNEKAVISMSISHNGKQLATGAADGKVMIWELAERKKILEIPAHRDPVFSLAFNPVANQLITSSWDGTIKIWDLNTGNLLTRIDLKNSSAYQVRFTNDGLYFVATLLNNALQLWEPDTKSVIREFVGHSDIVSSIDLSSDGRFLLSGSWDASIRVWDIQTGLMKSKIMTGNSAIHQATFSKDEKYLIVAGDNRSISFYDVANSKPVFSLTGHKAGITTFDQSPDGKKLLSYSLDGVIKLWDLKSKTLLFDHIHIGANDWMVRNSDGYFSGTDGAIQIVHFVSGMQTYMADQFFDTYFRPDLLKNPGKYKNTTGLRSVDHMLKTEPLPIVKLATYPGNNEKEAILMLKITNTGGGAKNLRILHNGKRIPLKHFQLPTRKDEDAIYTDTVRLVSGKNVFSASAFNQAGVETIKSHAEVFSTGTDKLYTCHIMVVGLNKYKNQAMNLNYARADAEGFANQLADKATGLYQHIVVHSLYDEVADKNNILDTLDKLSNQVNLQDVFIFFYAGHGSYLNDQFYLIPNQCTRAYDENALNKSAISAELLQQKFQKIKALKQVVIMDACHSGGSVEMLASR